MGFVGDICEADVSDLSLWRVSSKRCSLGTFMWNVLLWGTYKNRWSANTSKLLRQSIPKVALFLSNHFLNDNCSEKYTSFSNYLRMSFPGY